MIKNKKKFQKIGKKKIKINKKKKVKTKLKKFSSLKMIRKRKKKIPAFKLKSDSNIAFDYDYNSFSSIIGSSINRIFTPILFISLASFFLSYILINYSVSYYFIFFIPLVIFLMFFYSYITSLQKKYRIIRKNGFPLIINEDQLLKIQNMLPFNFFEPEFETTNWINEILKRVCLLVQDHLNIKIKSQHYLKSMFDQKLINFLELSLTKASIGKQVPIITGIHVKRKNLHMEDVIIDIGIIFNSDLNFLVQGKYSLKMGIERLFIQAQLRIILSPLFHEQPSIGKIYLMLKNVPKLDWTFNGALWFFNINLFKYIASKILFYWFGTPSKISINIAKKIPSRELKLKEPKGLVRIDVNDASYLPRADSCWPFNNVHAYCIVTVEDSKRWTQVINNTAHPEWNISFSFLVHKSVTNMIYFAVYDEESDKNKGKDRLIGVFSVSIDTFASKRPEMNGRELCASLRDCKTGVPLNKDLTKISFRVSWFRLSNDKSKAQAYEKLSQNKLPVAVLSVLIESIAGLETTAKQIQIPELRSLVRISVGNSTQVTCVKKRTGYPIWDQALHFLLFNPKLEIINIEVVDMYNILEKRLLLLFGAKKKLSQDWVKLSQDGIVLGYLKIPALDVFNSFQMKLQGNYRLEGFLKEAYIKLLVVIRITEFSNIVEDNSKKPRTAFPESFDSRL